MDLFRKQPPGEADAAAKAPTARPVKGAPLDTRRILGPVAFALMLALGVLFLFQTQQAYTVERALGNVERISEVARSAIAQAVREQQEALAQALAHPEIERYFATDLDGNPTRALAGLRERMPSIEDARFVGADVLDSIGADMASFGYANAEMLLSAARSGEAAPAQVHGALSGARSLVMASPAKVGGRIIGFALVRSSYAPVQAAFRDLPSGGLRLALTQGEGRGQDLHLDGALGLTGAASSAIPGTMLRIAYAPPSALILAGPSSAAGNLLVAVLCFLGAVLVLIWRQRPDLLERLLHPRAGGGGAAEATVADRVRSEAAATAAKVATAGVSAGTAASAAASSAKADGAAPAAMTTVSRSLFGQYEIGGIVGSGLNASAARQIGQAVGSEVRARGLQTILVGRDGRSSSENLADAVIKGLLATGCDVIDLGAVPTPVLDFAIHDLNAGSGVMVTGRHHAADYNGFAITLAGDLLSSDGIQELYSRIAAGRFEEGRGALTQMELVESYIERVSGDIQLETPLKVVIDCGNGIAGNMAQQLFEAIGCEVVPLYCDVDSSFPNHHPDPGDPRNLEDLAVSVKQLKADVGLAFGADGNRVGMVTGSGNVIAADRLLMLYARDLLMRCPGASILYDVSCSAHLAGVILGHGGSPIMYRSGAALIRQKMKDTQAELAGEFGGHFYFKERWYGFDDGLYAGCRLLEIMASEGLSADEIFEDLPGGVATRDMRIAMAEGEHYRFIEKFRERAKFDGARLTTIDGLRADWPDGWGVVHCSATTPNLILRFGADNGDVLARIQDQFRAQLLALDAKLALPF